MAEIFDTAVLNVSRAPRPTFVSPGRMKEAAKEAIAQHAHAVEHRRGREEKFGRVAAPGAAPASAPPATMKTLEHENLALREEIRRLRASPEHAIDAIVEGTRDPPPPPPAARPASARKAGDSDPTVIATALPPCNLLGKMRQRKNGAAQDAGDPAYDADQEGSPHGGGGDRTKGRAHAAGRRFSTVQLLAVGAGLAVLLVAFAGGGGGGGGTGALRAAAGGLLASGGSGSTRGVQALKTEVHAQLKEQDKMIAQLERALDTIHRSVQAGGIAATRAVAGAAAGFQRGPRPQQSPPQRNFMSQAQFDQQAAMAARMEAQQPNPQAPVLPWETADDAGLGASMGAAPARAGGLRPVSTEAIARAAAARRREERMVGHQIPQPQARAQPQQAALPPETPPAPVVVQDEAAQPDPAAQPEAAEAEVETEASVGNTGGEVESEAAAAPAAAAAAAATEAAAAAAWPPASAVNEEEAAKAPEEQPPDAEKKEEESRFTMEQPQQQDAEQQGGKEEEEVPPPEGEGEAAAAPAKEATSADPYASLPSGTVDTVAAAAAAAPAADPLPMDTAAAAVVAAPAAAAEWARDDRAWPVAPAPMVTAPAQPPPTTIAGSVLLAAIKSKGFAGIDASRSWLLMDDGATPVPSQISPRSCTLLYLARV